MRDINGALMRREVGWWEHLFRNVAGSIQEFFTGKNTLSPDSPDSPHFKEKYQGALEDSSRYVKAAEEAAERPSNAE